MNIEASSMRLLTQTYRDKALDTFIRGLKGDLPRLLGIKEPIDLPQALHLCLKLENQSYRTNHATHAVKPHYFKNTNPPPLPPRKVSNNYNNNFNKFQTKRNFKYPRFFQTNFNNQKTNFNNQRPSSNQFYRSNQNYFGNRNQISKPEPKPEPMDVDESIQTRNVNYMNRPPIKRNFSHIQSKQMGSHANKIQRNFHMKTKSSNEQNQKNESEDSNNVNVDFLG